MEQHYTDSYILYFKQLLSNTNGSGETYIAYLFASLNGISKVSSYTGTGYDINVDCGFTAGARFRSNQAHRQHW